MMSSFLSLPFFPQSCPHCPHPFICSFTQNIWIFYCVSAPVLGVRIQQWTRQRPGLRAADSLANENRSVFKYRLRAICWGAGGGVREQKGNIYRRGACFLGRTASVLLSRLRIVRFQQDRTMDPNYHWLKLSRHNHKAFHLGLSLYKLRIWKIWLHRFSDEVGNLSNRKEWFKKDVVCSPISTSMNSKRKCQ